MPRARRCADGEYPRCRVVVYRVIGYVLSAVNKLTKQEARVEREIRARYAELMGIYDDRYVFPFSHFCVFEKMARSFCALSFVSHGVIAIV